MSRSRRDPASRGINPFWAQDLVISVRATRYRRERWSYATTVRTILAPLPEGIDGHFGPDLRQLRC